jgi:hypothetical protein
MPLSFCWRASGTLGLPAAAHARELVMTPGNYRKLKTPDVCPACGEDVPRNALACPECGADHNSGWREDADTYDGIDLPEETFNHEEFVKREFRPFRNMATIKPVWWVTAILLLVAFAVIYFFAAH